MAVTDSTPGRERSIGELFGELANETSTLVRQEMKLATTELSAKVTVAARNSAFVMAGSLLGTVSLLTLAAAIVLLLGRWMPLWVSALIVTALFGAIGYGVARMGVTRLRHLELRPTETLDSLQENKTWAKQQLQ